MAKEKRQPGRKTPIPAAETTKPVTFRLDPATMATLRRLSDRLDLRSLATSIELGTRQMLLALERYDAKPPLTPDHLKTAIAAVKAAGVQPRRLGPAADYRAVLLAAVLTGESAEDAVLVDAVRKLDVYGAIWVIGASLDG